MVPVNSVSFTTMSFCNYAEKIMTMLKMFLRSIKYFWTIPSGVTLLVTF